MFKFNRDSASVRLIKRTHFNGAFWSNSIGPGLRISLKLRTGFRGPGIGRLLIESGCLGRLSGSASLMHSNSLVSQFLSWT